MMTEATFQLNGSHKHSYCCPTDEGDKVDRVVSHNASCFAGIADLQTGFVENVGVYGGLREGHAPARELRLGVDLVATGHHVDPTARLDEHVDGQRRDAVSWWTRLHHPT